MLRFDMLLNHGRVYGIVNGKIRSHQGKNPGSHRRWRLSATRLVLQVRQRTAYLRADKSPTAGVDTREERVGCIL